jgi:hypothetical protein
MRWCRGWNFIRLIAPIRPSPCKEDQNLRFRIKLMRRRNLKYECRTKQPFIRFDPLPKQPLVSSLLNFWCTLTTVERTDIRLTISIMSTLRCSRRKKRFEAQLIPIVHAVKWGTCPGLRPVQWKSRNFRRRPSRADASSGTFEDGGESYRVRETAKSENI